MFFSLVAHDRQACVDVLTEHTSFVELAVAAYELSCRIATGDRIYIARTNPVALSLYGPSPLCQPRAYSPRGHELNFAELVAFGERESLARRRAVARWGYWWGIGAVASRGYIRRVTPVPGTSRRVRGCFFRRPGTTAERRLAAGTLREDGEPGPRPARNPRNLVNAWDDVPRHVERGWKSQHRGRKAWDR